MVTKDDCASTSHGPLQRLIWTTLGQADGSSITTSQGKSCEIRRVEEDDHMLTKGKHLSIATEESWKYAHLCRQAWD